MGDRVREETKGRGMTLSDKNLGRVADEMRKKEGMDIWAKKCIPYITNKSVVIDGIRNIEEVVAFREFIKTFHIVAIHASPQIRYERLRKRKRDDDVDSMEKLIERDKRELGWGIGHVVATADIIITNEEKLEEFREKIRAILRGN
jgi:dephospho-CoA kinase